MICCCCAFSIFFSIAHSWKFKVLCGAASLCRQINEQLQSKREEERYPRELLCNRIEAFFICSNFSAEDSTHISNELIHLMFHSSGGVNLISLLVMLRNTGDVKEIDEQLERDEEESDQDK